MQDEDAHGFAPVDELPAPRHNQPPAMRPVGDLHQHLATTHAIILKRAADLIEAEGRMPEIIDEDTESKATDYIRAIQKCETELDAQRRGEMVPYQACAELIHTTFRKVQDRLVAPSKNSPRSLKERVSFKLKVYKDGIVEKARKAREEEQRRAQQAADEARRKREEEQRKAQAEEQRIRDENAAKARKAREEAEELERIASRKRNDAAKARAEEDAALARETAAKAERERRAAEDRAAQASAARIAAARVEEDKANEALATADKAAATKPAELSRSRGQHGGISSLRAFWTFRDLNRATLDLEALREHLPADALDQAVRSFVKAGGRKLGGVVIYEDTGVTTR